MVIPGRAGLLVRGIPGSNFGAKGGSVILKIEQKECRHFVVNRTLQLDH